LQVGDPDGRLQPTKRALAIGGAIAFGSSASFGLRRKWFGFFLVAAGLLAFWRWPTLGWHARDVVLALLGAAFLSAYVIQALWARSLLHTGYGAQGTVVKVEVDMGDSDTRTTYKPVVQFTTADGRKVVFTGSIGIGPAPKVESAVPVRYRPDDPDQAEIDRLETWLPPALFGEPWGWGCSSPRSSCTATSKWCR
jgi:hypothetical protein